MELRLYIGDAFRLLKKKQDAWKGKFRTVFADPPYFLSNEKRGPGIVRYGRFAPSTETVDELNVKKGYRIYKGDWDKNITFKECHDWNYRWLKLVKPLIAEDGTIWICGLWNFNLAVIRLAIEELGYSHLNNITIIQPNAVPNFRGVRFQSSTEDMIWARAGDKKYFAYRRMKAYNGGKQMKNYWEIPVNTRENIGRHSTQKTVEQVKRCILASTDKNDWVLDPFAGTCTTLKVAKMLQRNAIGVEKGFYYKNWRSDFFSCRCDKRFKEESQVIKHYEKSGHTPQYLLDINEKVGWGEQTLEGKIQYRRFVV